MSKSPRLVTKFEAAYRWWERKTKQKKHYRVADGITKDALYSMRDILRELPRHLSASWTQMPTKAFMATIASTYCGPSDARPTMLRGIWAGKFQAAYMELVIACAKQQNVRRETVIARIATRSEVTNRQERVTGDAICSIGDKIIRSRKQLERRQLFHVIKSFIDDQTLVPDAKAKNASKSTTPHRIQTGKTETVLKALGKVVREMRHGI
jgi:hypothetical protein